MFEIKQKDSAGMRGSFRLKIYKNGKLTEVYEERNLIVNSARTIMAHLLAGDVEGGSITDIAFGTNANVPAPEDTEITGVFSKPVTEILYPALG